MTYVPVVVEKEGRVERSWDIFSRLLKDRAVFVTGEVNTAMANSIIAQLLYLDSEGDEDITLYINSPGGSVSDGLAIIDTMNYINAKVSTICMGTCASMGAMILSQGEKGKRFILPNGEVMVHQPLGGTRGQATDIEIYTQNMLKTKAKMTEMLVEATGQPVEKLKVDMERDHWLNAQEALEYGIVDNVIRRKTEDKK